MSTYIRPRKNRITGTTIQFIDNRDGHFNSDRHINIETGERDGKLMEPWLIECIDHGMYSSHDTRKLAEYHAAVPEWCEGCQPTIIENRRSL